MQTSSPQRADLDFGLREEMISPIRPLKLAPTHEEEDEEPSQRESSPRIGATSLSPLAQKAAQVAAQFLQDQPKATRSLQPPISKWPSSDHVDSFDSSSTAGMVDAQFHQHIHCSTGAFPDAHKDMLLTAPLVSLETMSSTDQSGLRSFRSADSGLHDRRRYRYGCNQATLAGLCCGLVYRCR